MKIYWHIIKVLFNSWSTIIHSSKVNSICCIIHKPLSQRAHKKFSKFTINEPYIHLDALLIHPDSAFFLLFFSKICTPLLRPRSPRQYVRIHQIAALEITAHVCRRLRKRKIVRRPRASSSKANIYIVQTTERENKAGIYGCFYRAHQSWTSRSASPRMGLTQQIDYLYT